MALPETVRVKLSSEDAGTIAITQVVVQEMRVRELVEPMLGLTGKDAERVGALLRRGSLVSGGTRFRWDGWEAGGEEIRALLATFPDPDPSRPFDTARCTRAVLRAGSYVLEIPREAGRQHGWFRRASFWDALMEVAAAAPVYSGYSYKDRADRYAKPLTAADRERLRAAAGRLVYSAWRRQIQSVAFENLELSVERLGGVAT